MTSTKTKRWGFCERPRYGTALLLFRCGEGVGEKNGFDEKSGFCLVRMSWRPPRLEIYLGGGREKAGWRRRQNLVGRSARAKIFQRDGPHSTAHGAIVCCSLAVLVTVIDGSAHNLPQPTRAVYPSINVGVVHTPVCCFIADR